MIYTRGCISIFLNQNNFLGIILKTGYGLISKFEINDDTIAFEKKYVQSDAYKKAMAQQKPAISEFGTRAQMDSKKGFFSRVISTLVRNKNEL